MIDCLQSAENSTKMQSLGGGQGVQKSFHGLASCITVSTSVMQASPPWVESLVGIHVQCDLRSFIYLFTFPIQDE